MLLGGGFLLGLTDVVARLVAEGDLVHLFGQGLDGRALLVLGGGQVVGLEHLAGHQMDLVDGISDVPNGRQLAAFDDFGVAGSAQGHVFRVDGVQLAQGIGESHGCHVGRGLTEVFFQPQDEPGFDVAALVACSQIGGHDDAEAFGGFDGLLLGRVLLLADHAEEVYQQAVALLIFLLLGFGKARSGGNLVDLHPDTVQAIPLLSHAGRQFDLRLVGCLDVLEKLYLIGYILLCGESRGVGYDKVHCFWELVAAHFFFRHNITWSRIVCKYGEFYSNKSLIV